MSKEAEAVAAFKARRKQMVINYRKSQEKAAVRYEASLIHAARIYEVVMRAKAGDKYVVERN